MVDMSSFQGPYLYKRKDTFLTPKKENTQTKTKIKTVFKFLEAGKIESNI